MALLKEILQWTKSCPAWQRDAMRRLFQKQGELSREDYDELYDLFKAEHGLLANSSNIKAKPLEDEHIPAGSESGKTVILQAMRELENVNRIVPGQTLSFAEKGLTIIYGHNGSGKSGYARVLKKACRARDQSEPVHPDANNPEMADAVPTAKFDIKIADGDTEEVQWSRDGVSPENLSSIAVFDSKCARSYLTEDREAAYLPYGLDIVENLANKVMPELRRMLAVEIAQINVDSEQFRDLLGETAVGKHIQHLNAKSDLSTIKKLGAFNDKEEKRLATLNKALAEENPMDKADNLKLSAGRLKEVGSMIRQSLALVDDAAIAKLKASCEAKITADKAADAVNSLQKDTNLLPGTGNLVWKALFDAARRYSEEAAYCEHEFPYTEEGAKCPLCQQPLAESSGERLRRFDEYVKSDVEERVNKTRRTLESAKSKLQNPGSDINPGESILGEMGNLDNPLPLLVKEFGASIKRRQESMLDALESNDWSAVTGLTDNPCARIRNLAAQQLRASRAHIRAADEENRKRLQTEKSELSARKALSGRLDAVINLVCNMIKKEDLEECRRRDLDTTAISHQSKKFEANVVTKKLQDGLNSEFRLLGGTQHIKTKLAWRGKRGKVLYQPQLDLPTTGKDITEILSEGEQRVIAIGSFLAELSLADHSCGIIFDDPVSSLDHVRRKKVAERLAKEAKRRQVIIFTHDAVFLDQLRVACKGDPLAKPKMLFLDSMDEYSGKVQLGLPWLHQGYKESIATLEQNQRRLAKECQSTTLSEEQANKISRQYSLLRATLESVVEDFILNRTVKRFDNRVLAKNLQEVVGLQQCEVDAICHLLDRCHNITDAHNHPSYKNEPPPMPEELGQDINDLNRLIEKIKARRGKNRLADSASN